MHRQAQVQALAHGLLEARGGGELVVLLRGGDALDAREFEKGRRSRASRPVVASAAASSEEATFGRWTSMPRTLMRPVYLPLTLLT